MPDLPIPQWNRQLRVMLYRKHVQHETPKNFQLDLFTPDDGHFEYYAVATNMALGLPALYAFVCGRGAQEKTFGELQGRVRPRRRAHPPHRGQPRLAANERPTPHVSSVLHTRHTRGTTYLPAHL